MSYPRRYQVGAEVSGKHGTHFRVWAPRREQVTLVEHGTSAKQTPAGREYVLTAEGNGYHSGFFAELGPGALYKLRLERDPTLYPDPAARFQPDGPHGPSQVVDPAAFAWSDAAFREEPRARVLYELHLGTFTPEGTYRAAAARLQALAELGVTVLELMPVNGFVGEFGWGYDGVNIWAPHRSYGTPEDLRFFVATAHALRLAVILDVVYNHFGAEGCYLEPFSESYFTDSYECEWGRAVNFDGRDSQPVRDYVCDNARYWIEEFHFDGFRLDATQALFDASETHIIADIVRAARTAGQRLDKPVLIIAENEPQEARLVRAPEVGGWGADAACNDDFHHSAIVALTGKSAAYFSDYRGTAQELLSALKWGYLFQGQLSKWQDKPRGTPAFDLRADNFVTFLQNHDQVANSVDGARIDRLTSAAKLRAMTALLLLAPPTPMLFQGQEFAASTPFLYFLNSSSEFAATVARQRGEFLSQFPNVASAAGQRNLADPASRTTFERSKLDWSERERHAPMLDLHRDLLRLRRETPAISQRRADLVHGAVLAEDCLALRFCCAAGDCLLIVNLGADLNLHPIAEPLLAPPSGQVWAVTWCSEDLKYGGQGFGELSAQRRLQVVACSSVLFAPEQAR